MKHDFRVDLLAEEFEKLNKIAVELDVTLDHLIELLVADLTQSQRANNDETKKALRYWRKNMKK